MEAGQSFPAPLDFALWSLDFGFLNVLIIPDKFKGTLAAGPAADALARGWRRVRPKDRLRPLPMTDGGDGFGETIGELLGARRRTSRACDAAHRSCAARWWWEPKTRTAIVESANVIGLAMLPPRQFHPFELDSFGLGRVLRSAAKTGARRFLIGLGGSATNDAGFGLACALGWEFLDRTGAPIKNWPRLTDLQRIVAPCSQLRFDDLEVAVDVQNPLLGSRGASRIFGPQKGLRPADLPRAERALRRLARVMEQTSPVDSSHIPGAGAAGGLGFGFAAFLGARLVPGFELYARLAGLEKHLGWADLVITGEGGFDRSSLMGKGVGQIARRCHELRIPCVGVAGSIKPCASLGAEFSQLYTLTALTTCEDAKARPALWLDRLAAQIARSF